jgi:hypothetical protein
MKLLLTLTGDKGEPIAQVEVVNLANEDLSLSVPEFCFRNLVINRAIEKLQAEAKLEESLKLCPVLIQPEKYGGS